MLNGILRRERAVVAAALATVTLLAWAYLLWLSRGMTAEPAMPGMDMSGMGMSAMNMLGPDLRPWSAGEFVFSFAMWAIMMVGMMTPSAAPMVLTYAAVGGQAWARGKAFAATGWFLAGYLLSWAAFALLATAAQFLLTHLALLDPALTSSSTMFGGLILIAAGAYQWTPLKDACLVQCRSPLMFIQQQGGFRRDPSGAVLLGARHGAFCVGCCWMLMALLFVGGVMNVLWIALISVFVLVEKALMQGSLFSRAVGTALIAAGIRYLAG